MKTKCLHAGILSLAAGGLMLISGCVVQPDGRVAFQPLVVQPVVVATAPGPVVEVAPPEPVLVPDNYVWDGVEFVGLVGDQYFYLGPNHVWLVADSVRLERFHGWERFHPDWRVHAIRNDNFRRDAHGHEQPRRDAPRKEAPKKDEHDH
jgi:hypothetical protein